MSASYDTFQQVASKLEHVGFDPVMIQRKLQLMIKQQDGILAMNDAFLLSSYLCLALALLVWCAHSSRVPAMTAAEAVRELRAEELMEQP
jgi:DHA2 family multidrug resistance protein